MFRKRDYAVMGLIMSAAGLFFWGTMVRPYEGNWQPAGEASATIKTFLSNSNVFGAASIKAVVTFEDGRQTIVAVPTDADIRAGDHILLSVTADADNPERQRYAFQSAVGDPSP